MYDKIKLTAKAEAKVGKQYDHPNVRKAITFVKGQQDQQQIRQDILDHLNGKEFYTSL